MRTEVPAADRERGAVEHREFVAQREEHGRELARDVQVRHRGEEWHYLSPRDCCELVAEDRHSPAGGRGRGVRQVTASGEEAARARDVVHGGLEPGRLCCGLADVGVVVQPDVPDVRSIMVGEADQAVRVDVRGQRREQGRECEFPRQRTILR